MKLNLNRTFTWIIALVPILYNYSLVGGVTFGLLIMVALIPVEIYFSIRYKTAPNLFWIIYFLYFWYKCEFQLYYFLFSLTILCAITVSKTKLLNTELLKECICNVSLAGSYGVIIQTVVHMLIGIHIPMNIPQIIVGEYQERVLTGYSMGDTMYRPSAFFTEPSQFAVYCIVGLLFLIQDEINGKKKLFLKQVIIGLGMLCTTSGMGIMFVFAAFVYRYLFLGDFNRKKLLRLFYGLFIGIVIVLILLQIPVIQNTLARIFTSYEGYNAIEGRLFAADWLLVSRTENEVLWGVGYLQKPDYYVTGYILFAYCLGNIGIGLYALAFWNDLKNKSMITLILTAVYSVLFFFTSNVYTQSMIWWGILCMERKELKDAKRK